MDMLSGIIILGLGIACVVLAGSLIGLYAHKKFKNSLIFDEEEQDTEVKAIAPALDESVIILDNTLKKMVKEKESIERIDKKNRQNRCTNCSYRDIKMSIADSIKTNNGPAKDKILGR